MILGETSDNAEFRNISEETLIEEWLASLEPTVAAEYGNSLGPLARQGIKAARQKWDALSRVIYCQLIARRRISNPEANAEFNIVEELDRAIRAQKVYSRKELPGEPTGYSDIDAFVAMEQTFLAAAETPEQALLAVQLLAETRQVAGRISTITGPNNMLAA